MASRKLSIKARIEAEDRASGEIKKVETSFGRMAGSLRKNAVAIGVGVTAAIVAIRAMVGAISTVVSASLEQAKAVSIAQQAMEAAGEATAEQTRLTNEWAKSLQDSTNVGDEAALRLFALARGFSETNQAARDIVDTAADFAQAADIEITEATRRLGRAMQGSTEDVAKFAPEIANLTKQELAAGEATRILGERFEGFAEAAVEADGGITQLGNTIGDLTEALGDSITKNADVTDGIGELKDQIEAATPALAKLAEVFVTVFVGSVSLGISVLEKWSEAMQFLSPRQRELNDIIDATQISQEALAAGAERLGITVEEYRTKIEAAVVETKKLDIADREAAAATEKLDGELKEITISAKAMAAAFGTSESAASKLADTLGIVTSVQIAKQISDIALQLELVRIEGELTEQEFARQESIARSKISSLNEQLAALQRGEDGVAEATKAVASELGVLGDSFGTAAQGARALTIEADAASGALGRQAEAARVAAIASGSLTPNALTGGSSSFAQVGGGAFTSITPLPGTTADGRVVVTGRGFAIQNPSFVRVLS